MRKCARCNDFLDGHTCHSCNLRHQCEVESCICHNYPNLPYCLGSDFRGYSNKGSKYTTAHHAKHYGINAWDNRRSSLGHRARNNKRKAQEYALRAIIHEERAIHG